ncbi:MAG: hypothetical protein DMD96_23070 [Candidatus Rokuibacteriota bacterium]|nr:MAG: hypothetical protein DMD96_23070 [Candidatus Rokubacteria bacterium]
MCCQTVARRPGRRPPRRTSPRGEPHKGGVPRGRRTRKGLWPSRVARRSLSSAHSSWRRVSCSWRSVLGCFYSALFLSEGIGLLLRKRWAEYFTVIVTGSLIPLELYEIARRPTGVRVAVSLLNVSIVWYLARGLRRGT